MGLGSVRVEGGREGGNAEEGSMIPWMRRWCRFLGIERWDGWDGWDGWDRWGEWGGWRVM